MTVSLKSQIAEVEYELKMRRRVYPHQVAIRKMKQGEADMRIAHMTAVLETLRKMEEEERLLA
jgi:hypothetical protein